MGLLDHAVGDLDRRGQVEARVGGDQALLERGPDRERLEGRAGLVGEGGRAVGERLGAGGLQVARVEPGRVRHRQHVAGLGVHHDRGRALGGVALGDVGDRLLGLVLDRGVDRQLHVVADGRRLQHVEADRVAAGVVDDLLLAVLAAEGLVLGLLEPGQALVLGADGADHLRRQLALRVEALAVGERVDPVDLELLDLVGLVEVDLVGEVLEAGVGGRASPRAPEPTTSGRIRASSRAVPTGSVTWYGRRDDGGGLLGHRQHLAVAVEDLAPLAGDGHGRHLLGAGLGAQLAALHALQPGGARERDAEESEEDAEEEAEAPVDVAHRQPR